MLTGVSAVGTARPPTPFEIDFRQAAPDLGVAALVTAAMGALEVLSFFEYAPATVN